MPRDSIPHEGLARVKPRGWVSVVLGCGVGVLALLTAPAALAAPAAPTPSAATTSAAPAPLKPTVTLPMVAPTAVDQREIRAQLAPRRHTAIATEIGAKVQRMTVAEGEAFKAGQVLVQFDCALLQTQRQKSQAALVAAQATLKSNRRLFELNSLGKLELDISEAEVAKNQAELTSSEVQLTKCQITAPFAGRVSEQKVHEQQYAQPGQVLLEIIDDSSLELEFIAPSKWLGWLRKNAAFEVQIDETGKSYPARIVRTSARVDPVSQSMKFTGVIQGRFPDLVAGMSGRVVVSAPAQPSQP